MGHLDFGQDGWKKSGNIVLLDFLVVLLYSSVSSVCLGYFGENIGTVSICKYSITINKYSMSYLVNFTSTGVLVEVFPGQLRVSILNTPCFCWSEFTAKL